MKKGLRFDVFKRDGFICQYCGSRPPEVILEVDHILPKSKKGTDEIENLITSCRDCNRGKGSKKLTEPTKQVSKNIKDIEEKRNQLKEFYNYQSQIEKSINRKINNVAKYWDNLWDGDYSLNERGKATIRRFLKDFTGVEIKEAMDWSMKIKNVEGSFKYMCGILHNKLKDKRLPF